MATRSITGLTPRQEQRFVERAMTRFERSASGKIRREIRRGQNAIIKAVTTGYQAEAQEQHRLRLTKMITKHYERVTTLFGMRIIDAPKTKKDGDPLSLGLFQFSQMSWIRLNAGAKAKQIASTTHKQTIDIVKNVTEQAIVEGWSERETATALQLAARKQGGQLATLRSRIIARTETHNASTASSHMAAKAVGVKLSKQWVSAGSRVRDTHKEADGQVVLIDQPFIVDGEELMYPADTSGSAANVINCRCVQVYI